MRYRKVRVIKHADGSRSYISMGPLMAGYVGFWDWTIRIFFKIAYYFWPYFIYVFWHTTAGAVISIILLIMWWLLLFLAFLDSFKKKDVRK